MSAILMAISTIQKNEGKVPLCNLPIRNMECGNDFSCHYRPNDKEILHSLGFIDNQEMLHSFRMPKRWFCNEFFLFSVRKLEEELKKDDEDLSSYLGTDNGEEIDHSAIPTSSFIEEDLENKLLSKESVDDMFTFLEDESFQCYYALSKHYTVKNNLEGLQTLICYQETDIELFPNASMKVIFDIVYHKDGSVDVVDHIITTDEEKTMNKVVKFEQSMK